MGARRFDFGMDLLGRVAATVALKEANDLIALPARKAHAASKKVVGTVDPVAVVRVQSVRFPPGSEFIMELGTQPFVGVQQ